MWPPLRSSSRTLPAPRWLFRVLLSWCPPQVITIPTDVGCYVIRMLLASAHLFLAPVLICEFHWCTCLHLQSLFVAEAARCRASLCLRPLRICLQCRRPGFNPWVGKIPWRREWQPTSVFFPGEFHGQRHLAGYSPWSHKRVRHNSIKQQQSETLSTLNQISKLLQYWS